MKMKDATSTSFPSLELNMNQLSPCPNRKNGSQVSTEISNTTTRESDVSNIFVLRLTYDYDLYLIRSITIMRQIIF